MAAGPAAWLSRSRFLRYLIAGGVNTLFGFAVYSVAIVVGVPVWASLLVANVAGVIFNFIMTGRFVFRTSESGLFLRFVVAYLIVYGVNLLLIGFVRQWIASPVLAQALLTLPIAVFSYLLLKRMVFARSKPTPAEAAP